MTRDADLCTAKQQCVHKLRLNAAEALALMRDPHTIPFIAQTLHNDSGMLMRAVWQPIAMGGIVAQRRLQHLIKALCSPQRHSGKKCGCCAQMYANCSCACASAARPEAATLSRLCARPQWKHLRTLNLQDFCWI